LGKLSAFCVLIHISKVAFASGLIVCPPDKELFAVKTRTLVRRSRHQERRSFFGNWFTRPAAPAKRRLHVESLEDRRVLAISSFNENFDGVAPPALPAGWTTVGTVAWSTSNVASSSAPNSAFVPDVDFPSDNQLVSPVIPVVRPQAQLTFQHQFDLEAFFDGGVLEVSIGGAPFVDILAAGGSFAAGGYNGTAGGFNNPLAGRSVWNDSSGGFITTTVNLPASAAGQTAQFRWREGTDSSVGDVGWFVDDVQLAGVLPAGGNVVIDANDDPAPGNQANDGAGDTYVATLSAGQLNIRVNGTLVFVAPLASVTSLTFNGSNDNDTLTVDHSGGFINRPISFSGGGQTTSPFGDTLRMTGGVFTDVIYTHANASSGNVSVDGSVITYTGLEPIFDNMNAANRVFNFNNNPQTITLQNDVDQPGGAIFGMSQIASPSEAEIVFFNNPTTSLTVNGGIASDTINVFPTIDPAFTTPTTNINAGSGDDSVFVLQSALGTVINVDTQTGVPDRTVVGAGSFAGNAGNGAGTLNNILGTINVNDSGGLGALLIDDSGNAAGGTYNFTATQINRGGAVINYTANITPVQLATGSGADIVNVTGTTAAVNTIFTNDGSDEVRVLAVSAGDELDIDTGFGIDAVVIGVGSSAAFNVGAGTLAPIQGNINLNDAGAATAFIDDSGDASGRTFNFGDIGATPFFGGAGYQITSPAFLAGQISLTQFGFSGFQFAAGSGGDILNVNSTLSSLNFTDNFFFGNASDDVFNIDGDGLRDNNTFNGGDGADTFNVNVSGGADITATSLQINGGAAPVARRDQVVITHANARNFTFNYGAGPGEIDVLGFATPINIDTAETVRLVGSGLDAATVNGLAGVDDTFTVNPFDTNQILVFRGGNPYDGSVRATHFSQTQLPGVAGGSTSPDLRLSFISQSGFTINGQGGDGLGPTDDRLFAYYSSDQALISNAEQAAGENSLGFGAGILMPSFVSSANAVDDIQVFTFGDVITATRALGTTLVDVNVVAASFVQPDVGQAGPPDDNPGVIVNSGHEAVPTVPDPQCGLRADFVTVNIAVAFPLSINGGDPLFNPAAPTQGDRIDFSVFVREINVFSDKQMPPNVTFEFVPFFGTLFDFQISGFECMGPLDAPVVNLIGDNNDPNRDQNDNFVVVGQDVDSGFPLFGDVDGTNEFVLRINGSPLIPFTNVQFLNAFGDDQNPPPGTPSGNTVAVELGDIDTLELTPYADNADNTFPGGHPPRGWGIDVSFNEGDPAGTDGEQADLLIYHTSLGLGGGGSVSEDIVVQPSGPDNGEVRVTNATDGSVIVVVQYVANTDIIVVDDDGSLADTDSLTLRGTNPNGPQTSGNDTFTADFTAAGGVLTPQVVVTDPTNVTPILYRLRSFTGFNSIDLQGLAGNDNFVVRNRAGLTVNIDGGDPVFSADTLVYTAPTNATYSVGADPTTAHVAATGVGDTNLRNLEGVTINSETAGSDLFVNATQGPDAFALTTLGGSIPTVLLGARHQVGFNAGSTNFDSVSMQGAGGDDTFEIVTPLVGVDITASGGAGVDRTNVFSTAAAETATFTPVTARDATLAITGFGAIQLANVENATYDGGPGANDSLTIAGTAVDDLTLVNPTSNGTGSFISNESPAFSFRSFLALTVNGGAGGTDTVEITGTEGVDNVTSDPDTVFFLGAGNVTMVDPTVDRMVLRTLGGNDVIDLDLTSAALAKTIDAGAGNDMVNLLGSVDADIFGGLGDDILIGSPAADNIFGGPGNDTLIGAGGNDFLYGEEGNDRFGDLALGNGVADDPGNDHFFGGEGSDIFVWDPGDGSDVIEGGADESDLLVFNGNAGAEAFTLSAVGTRLELLRSLGAIDMDIAGVEQVDINAMAGADQFFVNDLYPTDVRVLGLNLNADGAADGIRLEGRNVSDNVNISVAGAVMSVTGLRYDVLVRGAVAADGDAFTFNGNDGNDTIVAPLSLPESLLLAAMFSPAVPPIAGNFVLNGNLGDDYIAGYGDLNGNDGLDVGGADGDDTLIGGPLVNIIRGGGGNDLIHGGDGADSLFGDNGDDTFVPGFDDDLDSVDGGLGFDTILVQGTSASERIDARQDAIGQVSYEVQGINGGNGVIGILGGTESDVIVPGSVEELRIAAGSGDDNIRVSQADGLVATPQFSLRFTVEGGPPGASDRLTVVDEDLGDTTIHRVGGIAGNGSYTVGLLAPVVYSDVEFTSLIPIDPVSGGTGGDGLGNGRLFVFKHDPFEQNNDRTNATFLGSGASINIDPTIDPGFDALFGAPGDEDWYRVVAQHTGDLDFRVFFRQQGLLANGRAGLPGDGNLEIAVYDGDATPTLIAGTGAFGTNDATNDERVRIPAVAGQTYYLRVRGAPLAGNSPAINVYNLSVINTPAPVPFDIELDDNIYQGTVTAGLSTTVFQGNAALPAINDFFNGKVVSFKFDTTTVGIRGEEALVVDYIGATRQFVLAVPLSATPAAGDTFQVESVDTGRNNTDDVTRDNTPTFFFRLDDFYFLNDLPGNNVPDSPPDEVIPIPFRPGPAQPVLPGYAIAIFDEGSTPPQVNAPLQTPLGFATMVEPGVYTFTVPNLTPLSDGSHFITARVQMIDPAVPQQTGFGARSLSLEIDVDTVEPPVAFGDPGTIGDGLIDDSDSFVIPNPETIFDLITNDLSPTFWGRAEANATVRLFADTFRDLDADGVFDFVDINGDGDFDLGTDIAIDTPPNGILEPNLDVFIGQTTAIPLDGNQQEPDGFWQIQSVINFNDPRFFIGLGGVRTVFATAEDVAGNVNDDGVLEELEELEIFIDVQGPQITDVEINEAGNPYDLFDPKPSNDGPTPLVNSIVVSIRDLPDRVLPLFDAPAFKPDIAENRGHYLVRGDYNGIIPILEIIVTLDPVIDGEPATGTVEIVFRDAGPDLTFNTPDDVGKPLPDDRFTLFINDEGIVDFAGNILDGESNADEPHDQDAAFPPILGVDGFPTGDGVPGGDFVARFTVDSRPEVAVWAAGSAWVDTNGNNQFDQNNLDFTNRDITYVLGLTSDDLFAGNFAANIDDPLTPDDERIADGFDKLAAYGRYNGTFRFLIDTDNDGVPNIEASQGAGGVNGLPVAGRFDGDDTKGDEVAIFNGARWFFDTDHDFSVVDAGGSVTINWPVPGYPIVGDFDGDGLDDLATWTDDVFSFDLSSVGAATGPLAGNARINGTIDQSFKFGFIGPGERPVAADMNQDNIEDIGIFVPARDGVPPTEGAEWYFLISGMVANNTPNQPGNNPAPGQSIGPSITGGAYPIAADGPGDFLSEATYGFAGDTYERGRVVIDPLLAQRIVRFDPTPFGNDQYIQYGDSFALPIVGNFDPPVTQSGTVGAPQRDPLDVNVDGFISPIDALLVVNFLNANSEPNPAAPNVGAEGPYIDVNNDGFISPLDALLVVNYLNAMAATGGEGEAEGEAVDAVFSDYDPADALFDWLAADDHKARKRR
jgi:hypothetical protein